MILGVYSMRDALSGFLQPTFEVNDQVAYRNFEHAIMTTPSIISSHCHDFTLYQIGTFDSETGRITPLESHKLVVDGNAILLRHKKEEVF
ncbi:nonstructural protein [Dipodfec virus RodF1_59]|uniref:Nonstructural protein n=1 Tax=Dipodfec virus RodF1_59 TaxID=2929304 RepID=A0A976R7X0_9VIRU|nr:nonstructural protein [Dipodfec virus RodF1_59]